MITEKDLQEAIAECQGTRNPNANTCMMLAAFMTIKDHMFPQEQQEEVPRYSYDSGLVTYESNSEFGQAVKNKDVNEILALVDEIMDTLQVLNPRLYNSIMMRL